MPTIDGLPDLPSGVVLNGTEKVAIDVEIAPGIFQTFQTTTGDIADLAGGQSGGGGGGGISALTGDVTASGTGSVPATIPNDTVSFAKMQNISAAARLLGRGAAAGGGDVQEIDLGNGLVMTGVTLAWSFPAIGAHTMIANNTGASVPPAAIGYAQFLGDFPYQSGAVPPGALVPMLIGSSAVLMDASNFPGGGGLPSIGANSLLANITGSPAVPTGVTYDAFFSDVPYQSGNVPGGGLVPVLVGSTIVMMQAGNFPGTGGGLPSGGATDTFLKKLSGADGDAGWYDLFADLESTYFNKTTINPQVVNGVSVFVNSVEFDDYNVIARPASAVATKPGRIGIQSYDSIGPPELVLDNVITSPSGVTHIGSLFGITANDQEATGTETGDILLMSEANKVLVAKGTTLVAEIDDTAVRALTGDLVVAGAGKNLKVEGDGGSLMLRGGTGTPSVDMCGFAQFVAGTVTVVCDNYLSSAGDPILLSKHISATVPLNNGVLYPANQVDGQFDIVSTNAADDGFVFWAVLKVNSA